MKTALATVKSEFNPMKQVTTQSEKSIDKAFAPAGNSLKVRESSFG